MSVKEFAFIFVCMYVGGCFYVYMNVISSYEKERANVGERERVCVSISQKLLFCFTTYIMRASCMHEIMTKHRRTRSVEEYISKTHKRVLRRVRVWLDYSTF